MAVVIGCSMVLAMSSQVAWAQQRTAPPELRIVEDPDPSHDVAKIEHEVIEVKNSRAGRADQSKGSIQLVQFVEQSNAPVGDTNPFPVSPDNAQTPDKTQTDVAPAPPKPDRPKIDLFAPFRSQPKQNEENAGDPTNPSPDIRALLNPIEPEATVQQSAKPTFPVVQLRGRIVTSDGGATGILQVGNQNYIIEKGSQIDASTDHGQSLTFVVKAFTVDEVVVEVEELQRVLRLH